MYVHPAVIAFLHGFARVAHASPRSFDWFAQPVGFPSTPNPKVIKVFFLRQNGSDQASSETRLSLRASSNPRSLKEAHFSCFCMFFWAVPRFTKNGEEGHRRLFFSFLGALKSGATIHQK